MPGQLAGLFTSATPQQTTPQPELLKSRATLTDISEQLRAISDAATVLLGEHAYCAACRPL